MEIRTKMYSDVLFRKDLNEEINDALAWINFKQAGLDTHIRRYRHAGGGVYIAQARDLTRNDEFYFRRAWIYIGSPALKGISWYIFMEEDNSRYIGKDDLRAVWCPSNPGWERHARRQPWLRDSLLNRRMLEMLSEEGLTRKADDGLPIFRHKQARRGAVVERLLNLSKVNNGLGGRR